MLLYLTRKVALVEKNQQEIKAEMRSVLIKETPSFKESFSFSPISDMDEYHEFERKLSGPDGKKFKRNLVRIFLERQLQGQA